jgi:hypothetical protein
LWFLAKLFVEFRFAARAAGEAAHEIELSMLQN